MLQALLSLALNQIKSETSILQVRQNMSLLARSGAIALYSMFDKAILRKNQSCR